MSRARCQVTRPCSRCTESLSARYGKVTGVPAEYTASLLGDDDDGAVDNGSEDDRSSLLGVVEAHAARHIEEDAPRNSSPNIAAVERARAANKGRLGSRLSR